MTRFLTYVFSLLVLSASESTVAATADQTDLENSSTIHITDTDTLVNYDNLSTDEQYKQCSKLLNRINQQFTAADAEQNCLYQEWIDATNRQEQQLQQQKETIAASYANMQYYKQQNLSSYNDYIHACTQHVNTCTAVSAMSIDANRKLQEYYQTIVASEAMCTMLSKQKKMLLNEQQRLLNAQNRAQYQHLHSTRTYKQSRSQHSQNSQTTSIVQTISQTQNDT